MGFLTKLLKFLVGILGSIFITLSILALFLCLVSNNMLKNASAFDEIVKDSTRSFVSNNREEVRALVLQTMTEEIGPVKIDKEQIMYACQHPELLKGVEESEMLAKVLTPEFCAGASAKTTEELNAELIDGLIDQNIDKLTIELQKAGGIKQLLEQANASFGAYIKYLFGGVLIVYLFGVLFTFAGSGFEVKKGLYRVSMKTGINLISIAAVFYILKTIKPVDVLSFLEFLKQRMPELFANVEEVPPLFMKFAATIMLDFMRMATDPLIPVALVAAAPFVIIVVVILVLRAKEKKEPKKQKEEVV